MSNWATSVCVGKYNSEEGFSRFYIPAGGLKFRGPREALVAWLFDWNRIHILCVNSFVALNSKAVIDFFSTLV